MAKGLLGELVNAQVAGACVGQVIGPAAVIGQSISAVESGVGALLSGIKGLIGSVVTLLPGGSGGPESGGDGTAGEGGGGSGGGYGGDGSGNPLLGPQLSGVQAGQGLGPGADLGESVPSADWLPYGGSGSKGPLGSYVAPVPDVGGVLFEGCAAELTEIEELTGAYWDAQASALVLVGTPRLGKHPARFTLPAMDRDHLAVALRAYLAGQPIGVSIDPPAEYRDGMKQGITPPDGTPMLVSYLGNTSGTLFGAIMFEADRLLKCLDKGTDNITKNPLRATVAGYVPLLEKIHPGDGRQTSVWHRFWFVTQRVELKHDAETGSLAFGDVRLKVLTETEMEGHDGANRVDPLDAEFCGHITEHYDEYAKDFPVLARLKELAKIAAVAKFLCGQKIPFDLGNLFHTPPQQVNTPASTPGISATSSHVRMERFGNVTRTHTVSLFGGVDIEPRIVVWPDDGVAKKMRAEAEKSRPSHSVAKWDVVEDHKDIMALAIRVGVLSTPFGESSDDHTFRTQDINSFMRIRRMYDSTSLRKGDFGPGWFLWVPYSISVVAHDGKRDEVLTLDEKATRSKPEAILVLRDHTRGDSYMLRRVADIDSSGRLAYCKVAEQTVHDGSVSFQYDPSFVLYRLDVGFLFEKDSVGYVFDRAGYLREISKDGRRAIRYERNEVRIQQILGDPDYHYVFEYEPSDKGTRIVKITASDGHVLWYEYDRRGCLAGWREGPNRRANYSYDVHCRLTERRDAEGRLVVRNIYDDFGRRVSVSDVVTTGSGKKIQRSIQEGRLMQIRDERGSYVSYRYDTYNNLSKIEAHNAVGARWEMAFDAKGRLIQFVGCNRCRWIISYDHEGRVNKIVDPHGRPRVFGWGNGSRLVQVRDHRGRTQSAEYDIAGLIRCLATSGGAAWTFDYDRGSVLEVKGPLGRMRTNVTEQLAGISTRSAIGVRSKYTHDTRLRCLETRSTGRGRLCVEYDTNGHVSRVRTEAGLMEYQVHEDSLIIEARLTYP